MKKHLMKLLLLTLALTLSHSASAGGIGFNQVFGVGTLDTGLEALASRSYGYKAQAFRKWITLLQGIPLPNNVRATSTDPELLARIFLLQGIAPVIRDVQTPSVTRDLLPLYEESMSYSKKLFGRQSLSDFPGDPLLMGIALQSIRISLEASQDHLASDAEREAYRRIMGNLGRAMASLKGSASSEQVRSVLDILNTSEAQRLLLQIQALPRTEGFGITILQYKEWMEKKLK